MKDVTVQSEPLGDVLPSLGVIALWIVLSLALGSLTLRRRTP
jgi:ABC-2 type transport system permease protein